LDEFTKLTGYCRSYGAWLLKSCGRKIIIPGKTVLIGEIKKVKRKRNRIYTDDVVKVLKRIWYIMDFPFGKRFAPSLKMDDPEAGKTRES
jgi:hypothetical protein